jgi:membrane-bound lytic murein transglycosylase B
MPRFFRSPYRLGFAALAATAIAITSASGQGFDLRSFFGLGGANTTGTLPPAPAPGDAPDWSGESGASGHPLMTADAIRSAAANFRGCTAALWPLAEARGVPRAVFDDNVAGLTPELRIMDLLDAQPEFTKSFWDYLDLLVSEDRIQNGRAILAQHRAAFDAMEKAYGVDRHFVAAIWGVESNYGTQIGERSVIRSTATLACIGRRQDFFREEFLSALEILARGDVRPDHLKGSWAGAFGPTQFMPTSFKRYAVDFDGDGRRDVVDSAPDLIASTANNLKKDGWVTGQTWGYEVVLPQGFDFLLADRARMLTMREWEHAGIRRAALASEASGQRGNSIVRAPDTRPEPGSSARAGGKQFPRPDDKAFLLVPAGARGPSFLMLQNFRVIMKYNPAEAYAMAIGHLADRLRGGGPFVQPWPRHERVLTRAERYELQQQLAERGFDVGEPDGRLGGKTRNALRQFQASVGAVPDGFASGAILERLRGR